MTISVRHVATLLIVSFFCLIVSGCANYPSDPADKTAHHLRLASKAMKTTDERQFIINMNIAARQPGQSEKIRSYLDKYPHAAQLYVSGTTHRLKTVSTPTAALDVLDNVMMMRSQGLLKTDEYEQLVEAIKQQARTGNENGSIPFRLGDSIRLLGLSDSPEQMRIIIDRSLSYAAESTHPESRRVRAIMDYAAKPDTLTEHRDLIEKWLPALYLNEAELKHVASVFPDYAAQRQKQLDKIGDPSASRLLIGSSTWKSLSQSDRDRIDSVVYVDVLDDSSFGTIVDAQAVDRSTPATHAGAVAGSALAQAAYIDRSISHENYSVWSQLGLGILGGIVGSALDSPAKEKYQYRYTVQLANGERTTVNRTSSTPFHESVGTCVMRTNLKPISQAACELTIDDVRKKYLIDI